MTGPEIQNMLLKKHSDYIHSPNDNESQPVVILTTQQCYKLENELSDFSRHANSVRALCEGTIGYMNFGSVMIKKKEEL